MERQIIRIDPDKCDGCGICISGCPEGALQLIDGKARLVREDYCDGLGACIGVCPKDAIRFETREAAAFDAAAVAQHMATGGHGAASGVGSEMSVGHAPATGAPPAAVAASAQLPLVGAIDPREQLESVDAVGHPDRGRAVVEAGVQPATGCPGLKVMQWAAEADSLGPKSDSFPTSIGPSQGTDQSSSELRHWPVQLSLVPPGAAFLRGADLLLTADCAPVAMGDFHRRLLAGRSLVLGCPKLDDRHRHTEKLAAIIVQSAPQRITVVHMEVPCCLGLVQIAEQAIALAGRQVPLYQVTVSREGQVLRAVARGG